MKAFPSSEIRAMDMRMTSQLSVSGASLMMRAGMAVACRIRRIIRLSGTEDLPVVFAAGHGNNGGDAFVAARFLVQWGYKVSVFVAGGPDSKGSPESLKFRDLLSPSVLVYRPDESLWDSNEPAEFHPSGTVFVDGLLGTGSHGAPRGVVASAICWLRRCSSIGPVVAIDLPSGLSADTGDCPGDFVRADFTVSFACPKQGFFSDTALDALGSVEIADIGFPDEWTASAVGEIVNPEWIADKEMRALIPRRPRTAHKGTFGHALIIGGSAGFQGAPALAASAAMKSGAGLISAMVPTSAGRISVFRPEVMVRFVGSGDAQALSPESFQKSDIELLARCTALAIGPGLSQASGVREAVLRCLGLFDGNAVVDADALNVLADIPWPFSAEKSAHFVLTPHPGEAARLLGCSTAEVQRDRMNALEKLVRKTLSTVVLKGAGTIVGAPGHAPEMLAAGNSGMATGGAGDVLTGLICGFLAQGLRPFDAARLGVWLHARAGDDAALRRGKASLSASDLLELVDLREIRHG